MATLAVPAPTTSLQAQHLAWIKQFAQTHYNTNVDEVTALLIPQYQGGGGGLYMKRAEFGFESWLQGARDALGPKRKGEADGLEKGKVVFVRELAPKAKKSEVVTVMWIMWHEMGHAVGDRQQPRNISEPYAYRFEYRSLCEAYNTGQLAQWGIQIPDLKEFYQTRKSQTADSAERQAFEQLLG
jgi:hypothetical protein